MYVYLTLKKKIPALIINNYYYHSGDQHFVQAGKI